MPKKVAVPARQLAPRARRSSSAAGARGKTVALEPAEVPSAESSIQLVTDDGQSLAVQMGPPLQRAAMEWSYVVRNRRRWVTQETARREQAERARKQLERLQIPFEKLANATLVEVVIPYVQEDVGWEARIFPWEYMLSAATADIRQQSLIVVRCLHRPKTVPVTEPGASPAALVVESAPGELQEVVSFESEHRLVESNLRDGVVIHALKTPTRRELEEAVRGKEPLAIHLTGVDVHQGARLVVLPEAAEKVPTEEDRRSRRPHRDGFLLRSEVGLIDPVEAEDLARIVNAGARKPALFACNAHNTAARICALAVAEGCDSALGFQDEFDDAVAELFFANFYEIWTTSEPRWGTLPAFRRALAQLWQKRQDLIGSGVVLWTSHPTLITAAGLHVAQQGTPPDDGAGGSPANAAGVARAVTPATPSPRREGEARDLMGVEVRPCPSLNYSLLHNNRDLFTSFRILKYVPEPIRDIEIEVVLNAGSEAFPYRASVDLVDKVTELRDKIRVPLTSGLSRAVREAVHSVLYIDVSWQRQTVYRNTVRVTLLDAGEWKDDDENRLWLPSFVLPRDPAVARIVDSAKGYLKVLRDDSGAGFDGYQPFDQAGKGEEAQEFAATEVDLQVQALWSALSYDQGLTYINPPPTYTQSSQRLRTPGEVLATHAGTCIDLALLFAACLEYVDIHPVIFLLEGHAFPGYWRSPVGHADFEQANQEGSPEATSTAAATEAESAGQRVPWQVRRGSYREVLSRVHRRHLVPLETVALTSRGSFRDACEAGLDNLRSSRDFHSMVDILLARRKDVTPLPLRDER